MILAAIILPGVMSRNAARAAEVAQQEARAQEASEKKAKRSAAKARQSEASEFELTPAAFDDVPTKDGLQSFALSALDDPDVGKRSLAGVSKAIEAIEEQGPASVVFVDMETGRGLSYQPDLVVYGASSFKALYALYVCEGFIESGAQALDSYCSVNISVGPDGFAPGNSYSIESLIESAITQSSNNAYGALRDAFDAEGFDEWATSLGAYDAVYRADSWFPSYSARSSARLWSQMYAYAASGTETAQWLYGLTGQTEVSFIRAGIEDTGATVHDKAGWCADPDPAFDSVSDAGIIEIDGRSYVMSILTGMPDSESNRELVGKLAAALLNCRDALGAEDGR